VKIARAFDAWHRLDSARAFDILSSEASLDIGYDRQIEANAADIGYSLSAVVVLPEFALPRYERRWSNLTVGILRLSGFISRVKR